MINARHSLTVSCLLDKHSTLKRFGCVSDYPKPECTNIPPVFLCANLWIAGSWWIFVSAVEKRGMHMGTVLQ